MLLYDATGLVVHQHGKKVNSSFVTEIKLSLELYGIILVLNLRASNVLEFLMCTPKCLYTSKKII